MTVSIEGLEMGLLIEQMGDKVVRRAIDKMRSEAQKLAEKARDYAPVDEGNLENAIKVDDAGGGRNELGQFSRKSVAVYIDMNMPAARDGKTVGDYAYDMHEHLEPVGPKKRGPLSEEKDGGRNVVGGGFLTRAMNDSERDILIGIAAEIKDVLDAGGDY